MRFRPFRRHVFPFRGFGKDRSEKLNLRHTGDAPRFEALREGGHSLIPIVVLIGLSTVFNRSAAGVSILTDRLGQLGKSPMGPRAVLDALALGARNTASTRRFDRHRSIVNVIGTTGLGNTLSLMIGEWAG